LRHYISLRRVIIDDFRRVDFTIWFTSRHYIDNFRRVDFTIWFTSRHY